MKIKQLKREIFVKSDIDSVWKFFCNPCNLSKITPPNLNLSITSSSKEEIYPGQIITYTVTPFPLIKMEWMTEITQVKDKHFFIDEQKVGPYKVWHHQHFFKEVDGGVLVSDEIHYCLPFYPFSEIAHSLMVRSQLKDIFDYRERTIKLLEI